MVAQLDHTVHGADLSISRGYSAAVHVRDRHKWLYLYPEPSSDLKVSGLQALSVPVSQLLH